MTWPLFILAVGLGYYFGREHHPVLGITVFFGIGFCGWVAAGAPDLMEPVWSFF